MAEIVGERGSIKKEHSPKRLTGKWLMVGRVLWLSLVILIFLLWILAGYELLTGQHPDCHLVICDNIEFSAGDIALIETLDLPPLLNYQVWHFASTAYGVLFFAIGGLIYLRRSDEVIALLISFMIIYMGTMLFSTADDALRRTHPELNSVLTVIDFIGVSSLLLVLLTFPDGRIHNKWASRIVAVLFTIMIFTSLFTTGTLRLFGPEVPASSTAAWMTTFIGIVLIGLITQILRYRHHSSDVQRQQTKWVLFGLAAATLVMPLWGYIGYAHPPTQPSLTRLNLIFAGTPVILVLSTSFPLSVAFSILRYRLFAIDRLIQLSLVYTTLTGLLALIYFLVVISLQGIFGDVGRNSPIAIVATTLGIAAIFTPLRQRVQSFIDRLFYRRKYNLATTLNEFSRMLRDELEVEALSGAILDAIEETLQPEHTAIWLNSQETPVSKRVIR